MIKATGLIKAMGRFALVVLGGACLIQSPASAQTLSNDGTALSFGTFFANTGGTVVMDPATGTRSATGTVTLLTAFPGAVQTFTVTNTLSGKQTYSVTLAPATITLTRSGGSETMSLALSSVPATGLGGNGKGLGTLPSAGTQTLTVGGTLTVGNAQVAGSYSGSYDVTVIYQ